MTSRLPWFRLYHRIIDDEKIRLLAFEDRWHFIALCCLKADGLLDEPDSELKDRKIAVKLGVQLRELDEIKRRLHEIGLVTETFHPVSWNELQYQSDSSTARVREFRKKQKRDKNANENKVETERNVSVTAQDTETEADTEKKEPKGSTPKGELMKVLDAERASAVVEHRRKIRAPLTASAAQKLAAKLAKAPNPNEAADEMLAHGWRGFEVEWLNRKTLDTRQARQDFRNQPEYRGMLDPRMTAEELAYAKAHGLS